MENNPKSLFNCLLLEADNIFLQELENAFINLRERKDVDKKVVHEIQTSINSLKKYINV